MPCKILLAISHRQCAQAALTAVKDMTDQPIHSDDELVVLGVVQPFRTTYAHKHPLIGRSIRDLLWQLNRAQAEEVAQVVRDLSADLESLGWRVRQELREGEVAVEISRCCQEMSLSLLVVGSCLGNPLALRPSPKIWERVVRDASCPVLLLKHVAWPRHSMQPNKQADDRNHLSGQDAEYHAVLG